MIDLYYWPTPNGHKVTILLEETGLPYRVVPLNIGRGDQFAPEFLKLNPNHRMPVIVDHEPGNGAAPFAVFESGAILMYLAEKAGRFWPQDFPRKYEAVKWVVWQMANQGPKSGENGHFRRAEAAGKHGDLSYSRRRFDDEVNRLYGVLNLRLSESEYLGGADYSIADMACYPWASRWDNQGQDIAEFVHVKRWLDAVAARPAVAKGMAVGADLLEDLSAISPEEMERRSKFLLNQRARPLP